MICEVITLNEKRNVTLTCYRHEADKELPRIHDRPAIIVIPGGGYQFCSDREADPVAMAYLCAGFHAFVLRYSMKEDSVWPNPLEDYEQAMTLIRENAEAWRIAPDKIAVIGFSAGGHLAAAAATASKNRPNAAILCYAVAGEHIPEINANAPDASTLVDAKTCPCFLFHTRTDTLVPVTNALCFMEALEKCDIAFESHIYSYGPHGVSVCTTEVQDLSVVTPRAARWVEDSVAWLKEILGDFGPDGFTAPVCEHYVNRNHEAFLSAECTFGYLLKNPEAKEIIVKALERTGFCLEQAQRANLLRMPLKDVFRFHPLLKKELETVDAALCSLQNHSEH